jgi:hypothetical protein
MPAGRPTTYDPSYCERVIQHMATGASVASFAAEIEVARATINNWMEQHEEFLEAVSIAKAKCAAWWEVAGRKIVLDGGSAPQATMVTLGLKNMAADDWREKSEVKQTIDLSEEAASWLGHKS